MVSVPRYIVYMSTTSFGKIEEWRKKKKRENEKEEKKKDEMEAKHPVEEGWSFKYP